ncbi:diguanylate phosphodiesterase [Klebsiella sp. BIGb0407]|uniref:diguanylate phosphodiesterase n=1 Tax=Klebsiella sp. BIGb0407 TaxID=2940603 RepID=UPI00216940E2|nr:diguanylate phosphodiesterase [Klebsiella sp. BIGb0407]MCS3431974.1 EAL domain-containing protein (putative c-di-GMP-specific phosphodiesterase class I) [Klebsiella sp. BIGb0407]
MLTTLIYQSQLSAECSDDDLRLLARIACEKNKSMQVTGILLFNGSEFFQVLEGEEHVVDSLFRHICDDPRHNEIVELMRDYSAYRRFSATGMTLFELQKIDTEALADELHHMSHNRDLPDDRVFRFLKRFIAQGGWYRLSQDFNPAKWQMVSNNCSRKLSAQFLAAKNICTFAFQPIVEPMSGKVSSFEALIRSPEGKSPEELFASVPPESLYTFDLETKAIALQQAGQILRTDEKISINLFPGSLYTIPGSVALLVEHIKQANLRPDQVIIEVLETELITRMEDFHNSLKDIRAAGIGIAIDDFGSGYSRLSLLSKFQPDKIKLDRALIVDIHKNGIKQAMIAAIVKYCEDMGIKLVAEGVEKLEEWCWLQSIGVRLFQGYLFARPCLNGISEVHWPGSTD